MGKGLQTNVVDKVPDEVTKASEMMVGPMTWEAFAKTDIYNGMSKDNQQKLKTQYDLFNKDVSQAPNSMEARLVIQREISGKDDKIVWEPQKVHLGFLAKNTDKPFVGLMESFDIKSGKTGKLAIIASLEKDGKFSEETVKKIDQKVFDAEFEALQGKAPNPALQNVMKTMIEIEKATKKIQELNKESEKARGKVSQTEPARNPEFDAMLAKGPTGAPAVEDRFHHGLDGMGKVADKNKGASVA